MQRLPYNGLIGLLNTLDHFILLESNDGSEKNKYSYLFTDPHRLITYSAGSKVEFKEFCDTLQSHTDRFFIAGFVTYETVYVLHERLHDIIPTGEHESFMGIYAHPYVFDHQEGAFDREVPLTDCHEAGGYEISQVSVRTSRERYLAAVECIKKHIADGNTYQVNYTTHLDFTFSGSPLALYRALRSAQPTSYSALIKYKDRWILSLSPELFFKIEGNRITARPMKGTIRRGRTNREDSLLMEQLRNDPKNRAENLMIVDLLRNDIGRLAETGSVDVEELFAVEKYRSVIQMTSTVTGSIRRPVKLFDLFDALFPCGSVTGAPKLRTMQLIHELEDSPRGVYTGAIGMVKPGGDAVFNVPIRTIEIRGDRGSMGIGSGIVWDSDPSGEFEECLLKAHFLTKPYKPIELFESLRYENGYHRLDLHCERLLDSAKYFVIPVDLKEIKIILNEKKKELENISAYKIRLTVDEECIIRIGHEKIPAYVEQPVRLKLCSTPTDSTDRFLYHKTTNRKLYQDKYNKAQAEGYFDVLFHNERGEMTEGSITNVYIKENGTLYTPPVECGLLDGIFRRTLIRDGKAKEKIITVHELLNAEEIYVSNSVRGLLKGYLR
jgi:para-aminobenzoate synthetase / 4-amino-4-deoxychorismate lyase